MRRYCQPLMRVIRLDFRRKCLKSMRLIPYYPAPIGADLRPARYNRYVRLEEPDTLATDARRLQIPRVTLDWRRLQRSELPVDTLTLARSLLGRLVVHDTAAGRVAGRIVETEAYLPGDPACHAATGKTVRNASLFRAHGHAYVYFIYGSWFMLNVASETTGTGAGVLVRAVQPVAGLDLMRAWRRVAADRDMARGPGRLAQALAVTRAHDGLDLCADNPLWLAVGSDPVSLPGVSVRIGISRAIEQPWRFYERGNPHVSGPTRLRT